MAAITQIPSAGDKILREREHASDHSWQDFIGDSNTDPSVKSKSGSGSSGPSQSGTSEPNKSSHKEGNRDTWGDKTSGDSLKNKAGKSSVNEISSAKSADHAEKAKGSSDTNTDSSGKSSRSAHPNVIYGRLREETLECLHFTFHLSAGQGEVTAYQSSRFSDRRKCRVQWQQLESQSKIQRHIISHLH